MKDGIYKIKSWDALVKEYVINDGNEIEFPNGNLFCLDCNDLLPDNRIVMIDNDSWKDRNGFSWHMADELVEYEVKDQEKMQGQFVVKVIISECDRDSIVIESINEHSKEYSMSLEEATTFVEDMCSAITVVEDMKERREN
jgi:hypothetical protein